ncbi:1,4-dihydroxy-2-naphthoate octaprenyltransferase [Akkermansiaceae bacterium]|nr:1,4-dihydroxy-2-naphthoate octaprenyltransferase [Akkermansiaceae bacterium]
MNGIGLKSWWQAARPKTLPAAIAPVWAGCVLAWTLKGQFDGTLAAVTLLLALFIQVATNFFNDVIDADKGADTEARQGPQRVTASGLISRKAVISGAVFMLILAAVCGLYLWTERGWVIIAIGVPCLYLTYGYTGGPFPLAYRGWGEVFVILFFGLVAVGGTVFIQLGYWPREAVILGLQVGMLSAVLIAVNNYRDVNEDRAANKRTIVVRFGRPFTHRLILMMTVLPYVLIAFMGGELERSWQKMAIVPLVIFTLVIFRAMRRAQLQGQVESKVLGIAALHLIVFVTVQTLALMLTK